MANSAIRVFPALVGIFTILFAVLDRSPPSIALSWEGQSSEIERPSTTLEAVPRASKRMYRCQRSLPAKIFESCDHVDRSCINGRRLPMPLIKFVSYTKLTDANISLAS